MAFAIGMTPDQARAFFSHPDDLIEKDGRMWVPIEVTAVQDGFLRAWQLGAREWRESTARGEAGFWPTHDAWKLYEPVAIIGTESSVEMPKTDALLGRYTAAMQAFIDREIAPRVEKINAEISAGKQSPGPQNKLGVLYARYGVYDKAEDAFRASIKIKESAPAYVNLGNILMMKKDFAGALKAYQSAQRISPTDTNALIGLVRSTYELDDRGSSSHWLDVLNTIDQAVAQKYAYVKPGDTTGTRAGQAGQEDMPWVE
jgi:tetratricopeptide (TPR) repeat protein